jgi:hypothetical protein
MTEVKIIKIWKDHSYRKGRNAGALVEAVPEWTEERGGYDVYPRESNKLADAEVVASLERLAELLKLGKRVRCIVPANGDRPILTGPFRAIIQFGK